MHGFISVYTLIGLIMCEKVVNLSVHELKSVEAAECRNNLINSEKEEKMVQSEDKLTS